jgi:hypothetical protein
MVFGSMTAHMRQRVNFERIRIGKPFETQGRSGLVVGSNKIEANYPSLKIEGWDQELFLKLNDSLEREKGSVCLRRSFSSALRRVLHSITNMTSPPRHAESRADGKDEP